MTARCVNVTRSVDKQGNCLLRFNSLEFEFAAVWFEKLCTTNNNEDYRICDRCLCEKEDLHHALIKFVLFSWMQKYLRSKLVEHLPFIDLIVFFLMLISTCR